MLGSRTDSAIIVLNQLPQPENLTMERPTAIAARQTSIRESALATNKVLRNTYLLLSATLAFSAIVAGISLRARPAFPQPWITLIVYFAPPVCRAQDSDSAWGLLSRSLRLTGFLGYTLGPIIGFYLQGDSERPCGRHERLSASRRLPSSACPPTRSRVGAAFRSWADSSFGRHI